MNDPNKKPNQCRRIMAYLEEHGAITAEQARQEFGCQRLASRIDELRQRGISIKTTMQSGKNRFDEPTSYAVYSLKESKEA